MSKQFFDYVVGDIISERTITFIYVSTPEYIVYEIDDNGFIAYQTVGVQTALVATIRPLLTDINVLLNTKKERSSLEKLQPHIRSVLSDIQMYHWKYYKKQKKP